MRTPQQIAAMFGCTPEQAAAQYRANASQLARLAARATSSGKKVNGFTARELTTMATNVAAAARG